MEEYLAHVRGSLDLRTVDASGMGTDRSVALIREEDGETEFNPHIWLSVPNAKIMVCNIADGLTEAMPQHADAIAANRDAYLARLDALDAELRGRSDALSRREIVTFHEAFPYFAEAYGLRVVSVMASEPGEALSARELMDLVREERSLAEELGYPPPLFVEPQYTGRAADAVAAETGAAVFRLDPCVTGPADPPLTYYEDVMLQNMTVLEEACGGDR
jgi:zinc transport system substrate-binding protein